MKKYGALVIGASFASVGYAAGRGDTLIVEKTEMLDTSFYLPMVGFEHEEYKPRTSLGEELLEIFDRHGLFSSGMQNVHAFEIALCRFAERHPTDIYLKCRVVDKKKTDGGYIVTLLHNGGLEDVEVGEIIDCSITPTDSRTLTVVFSADEGAELGAVSRAFPGALVEQAFYSERYAVGIPIALEDINDAKCYIYDKWQALEGLSMLYIAPAFYYAESTDPVFGHSKNPIEAFERGLRLGEEGKI